MAVSVPLLYLFVRAFQADPDVLRELMFRSRVLSLLGRTFGLALAVVLGSALIATPLAWITTQTNLKGRGLISVLSILPLAMPGYVLAFSLLAATGQDGALASLFGWDLPRISGFWGAWIALCLYNFPYLFLNLRSAWQDLDPALVEAARSLGASPLVIFRKIVFPHLRPAYLAGSLLIVLYVLGDFGVVSLMRYETFSYAIFLQYTAAFDRLYAAGLSLVLVFLTIGLLSAEWKLLQKSRVDPSASSPRSSTLRSLGRWAPLAYGWIGLLVTAGLVLPIGVTLFWMFRAPSLSPLWTSAVWDATLGTLKMALPSAIAATLLALPIAILRHRYSCKSTDLFERFAHLGYATPALALGLGFIFFSLRVAPAVYQTAGLLILAYTVHFLAQAIGPIRSRLFIATPKLEEAARSLGKSRIEAFRLVLFPILRPGLQGGMILVTLSVLKELPLTFLLAPLGYQSLSLRIYDYTTEALYAQAAPFVLTLLGIAALAITLLARSDGKVIRR